LIPSEESNSSLLCQAVSDSGKWQVRFRKGTKNDKDVFIEVWTASGFVASLKATDKLTKVYNDSVFGGFAWSPDETKIAFVGEVPEVATFKNPFEETKKEEESKGEKPEENWQEDKFLYINDFGEGLNGKKQPAIFVFNLIENSLERLQGIPDGVYPQRPIFDEHSRGILFSGVSLPYKKLGLIYCLNRPTKLYYIQEPVFDKKKLAFDLSTYLRQINPADEYMAMH
jgi:acylaminoacyl-peptidase